VLTDGVNNSTLFARWQHRLQVSARTIIMFIITGTNYVKNVPHLTLNFGFTFQS